ncbi:MAG: hypothetical protein ACLP3B_05300 [Syntrophobacteraceae bacterium]
MKATPPGCSQPGNAALPECFGDGERVCPIDEEGIMQPQSECVPCPHLRPCLQSVMVKRGKLRIVEAPPCSKVTGFIKRWSDQKLAKIKDE